RAQGGVAFAAPGRSRVAVVLASLSLSAARPAGAPDAAERTGSLPELPLRSPAVPARRQALLDLLELAVREPQVPAGRSKCRLDVAPIDRSDQGGLADTQPAGCLGRRESGLHDRLEWSKRVKGRNPARSSCGPGIRRPGA